MSLGIFSNFQAGVPVQGYNSSKSTNGNNNIAQGEQNTKPKTADILKKAVPIAVPLLSIPVAVGMAHKITSKNISQLSGQIKDLTSQVSNLKLASDETVSKLAETLKEHTVKNKKANAQIWSALVAAAGLTGSYTAGAMSKSDKARVGTALSSRINGIESNAVRAGNDAQKSMMLTGNNLTRKYTDDINGILLLKNTDSLSKNAKNYDAAIEQIRNAAPKYLYKAPNVKPITSEHPTIWSVTSEYAPVKEGGLGSVPVEVQNNISLLGIDIPTFIPMYQQKGMASLKQEDGKYTYTYKGKPFELEKAISFKVDTYQGGKAKTEDVDVFVSTLPVDETHNKKLIFIKNDNYFNGTIYQTSEKSEEQEKFAFFSKAVYEFAKAKEDINSVKGVSIGNKEAFDSIKSPDAFILNDWQAAPIAALSRYKAPMEHAYGQLSEDAAKKLSDMTIITIGHNTMYQGSTQNNNDNPQRKESTTNILNTLFDGFASDIVNNAVTGASSTNPSDFGLKNLDNVLIINKDNPDENHTNLLNMGICLSDYFHPVSKNYAKEIISDEHKELSGEVRWALNQKNNAGSLVGIINGNDFRNLSLVSNLAKIKKGTALEFASYDKSSTIDDIMKARTANKIKFYNNFMIPFSLKNDSTINNETVENVKKNTMALEFVDKAKRTKLPELSDEELKNTPIISSVGRLVTQKGIPYMTGAIKMLMDNWEKDFPGKNKPIFFIAGGDGENGRIRAHIENWHEKELSQEDAKRVVFAHGFAPMAAITASSDFFMLPSLFEPCGLTQSEAFALATPVIGSAVGGIVDTVNRNGKHNGVLTSPDEPLTAKGLYEALKKGLDIYFNDKQTYNAMVKDSLDEDFSWIQPNKKGPVFDYLKCLGVNTEVLPDIKS